MNKLNLSLFRDTPPPHSSSHHSSSNDVANGGLNLALTLLEWRFRVKTRAQLARLSPDQWRDIGLDEATVREELAKPFWR